MVESPLYIVALTLVIIVISFFSSSWRNLQIDFLSGSIGLLVSLISLFGESAATGVPSAQNAEVAERFATVVIFVVVMNVVFGVAIFVTYYSFSAGIPAYKSALNSKNTTVAWKELLRSTVTNSVSVLAAVSIYQGNVSLALNRNRILEINHENGGAITELLEILFLPHYVSAYHYVFAFLIFSSITGVSICAAHGRPPHLPLKGTSVDTGVTS